MGKKKKNNTFFSLSPSSTIFHLDDCSIWKPLPQRITTTTTTTWFKELKDNFFKLFPFHLHPFTHSSTLCGESDWILPFFHPCTTSYQSLSGCLTWFYEILLYENVLGCHSESSFNYWVPTAAFFFSFILFYFFNKAKWAKKKKVFICHENAASLELSRSGFSFQKL